MKAIKLNYYLTKYFDNYLPMILGASSSTISSYKDTFISLLTYLKDVKKININTVNIFEIKKQHIEDFLIYLEKEKKNTISTRNQRLSSIKSFYKYLQYREISLLELSSNICSIPKKKSISKTINYFSINEIKVLLNSVDSTTKGGLRDYVLLLFMYETGCRAQELVSFTLPQLNLSDNNYVILRGKGNKERMVPITNSLAIAIKKLIKTNNYSKENTELFKNNQHKIFTTKGIEYILKKYINISRVQNKGLFKSTVSNHSMRHSRAMHLLESGVNLIYIRDFLGHVSVTTTEIYAKANPITKEIEIAKHSTALGIEDKYTATYKEDLIQKLRNKKL